MGRSLLAAIRVYDPAVTPAGLLRLEFAADESTEMPIVWVTAQTLLYSWGMRLSGRVVDLMVTGLFLKPKSTSYVRQDLEMSMSLSKKF